MAGQSKPTLSPWGSAVAGATGAVLANAMVYPLDLVKTKLQVQIKNADEPEKPGSTDDVHYKSTWDAITKIVDKEGVEGLYSGMAGSLIGVASTNFAYFYWYSIVRTLYMSSKTVPKPPGTAIELSLGAVAGAVAQIFTIPVAVITTRQQTQPKNDKKGLIETGKEVVYSEDGWSGLWRGLKASLILVVNPAITYGAYQRLKDIIFPGKTNLRPWKRSFSVLFPRPWPPSQLSHLSLPRLDFNHARLQLARGSPSRLSVKSCSSSSRMRDPCHCSRALDLKSSKDFWSRVS